MGRHGGLRVTVVEQLGSSTHIFLCSKPMQHPLLWLFGLGTAGLQSVLLALVYARAEANMFYEFYEHHLVSGDMHNLTNADYYHPELYFPQPEMWRSLGRTRSGPASEAASLAAAGFAGGATFTPPDETNNTASLERYNLMVEWSRHHPFLPSFLTHPDLQLDYALLFSLAMILIWSAKDATDAALCLANGRFLVAFMIALQVVLAVATGWDQMYVKFLPIFVWDVPANVIGISPISMILDSVAVCTITCLPLLLLHAYVHACEAADCMPPLIRLHDACVATSACMRIHTHTRTCFLLFSHIGHAHSRSRREGVLFRPWLRAWRRHDCDRRSHRGK